MEFERVIQWNARREKDFIWGEMIQGIGDSGLLSLTNLRGYWWKDSENEFLIELKPRYPSEKLHPRMFEKGTPNKGKILGPYDRINSHAQIWADQANYRWLCCLPTWVLMKVFLINLKEMEKQ